MISETKLKELSSPEVHRELGIYPKWRIDAKVGNKRTILPYYDADQCRDILDGIVGIENWQAEPRGINGKLFFSVGINIGAEGWIYKADAGGERNSTKRGISDVDAIAFRNKTEASNAFVRACKAWGIGRHLKQLPDMLLEDAGSYNVKTPQGQVLSTPEQLSAYCNGMSITQWYLLRLYYLNKESFDNDDELKEVLSTLKKLV